MLVKLEYISVHISKENVEQGAPELQRWGGFFSLEIKGPVAKTS